MRKLLTLFFMTAGLSEIMLKADLYTEEGFRIPAYNQVLNFPGDHGSHPDYKIEWWYFVGHLKAENGREFGYQMTFFRYADSPPMNPDNDSSSDFNEAEYFMTHVALTDIEDETFYFEEKINRGGWDAWSKVGEMDIRNGNWTAQMVNSEPGKEQINSSVTIGSDIRMELLLESQKPVIRFGDYKGLSIKGPDRDDCSLYITFTRLKVEGYLRVKGEDFRVTGTSWMDHEVSSSQLGDGMEGWDWTAIQLDDGWEIKAYILRLDDGSPSAYSRLIWISPEGELYYQTLEDWEWNSINQWESPQTGILYPNSVSIRTTHPVSMEALELRLYPKLNSQEIIPEVSETHYWEGACFVKNQLGETVGQAYLELTGYGEPIGEGIR